MPAIAQALPVDYALFLYAHLADNMSCECQIAVAHFLLRGLPETSDSNYKCIFPFRFLSNFLIAHILPLSYSQYPSVAPRLCCLTCPLYLGRDFHVFITI